MHYFHRTILSQKFVPIIVGMGVWLSGCGQTPTAQTFQKRNMETQIKLRSHSAQEIAPADFVYLYATYAPDQLLELATEQKRKYDNEQKLSAEEVWALGNVLRVVAYNQGITCAAPVEFESFQSTVGISKGNGRIEKILAENANLAGNVLENVKIYLPADRRGPSPQDSADVEIEQPINWLDILTQELVAAIDSQDPMEIAECTRKAAWYLVCSGNKIENFKPASILLQMKECQTQERQQAQTNAHANAEVAVAPEGSFIADHLSHVVDQHIAVLASLEETYSGELFASASAAWHHKDSRTLRQRSSGDDDDYRRAVNSYNMQRQIQQSFAPYTQFQSSPSK